MAFTRATIRNLAKESGVEIPKELEDALVSEHLTARNAYAEEQVKAELEKQPAAKAENVKESEEYKALKADFDNYKAEVAAKETKAAKEAAYRAILKDANLSEKGIEKAIKYAEWDKIELGEDGKLYLCQRTGEAAGGTVVLQYMPHELVGNYFVEVT